MSNRSCRVPFAPEMNSFQGEIGCNQRLVAAAKLEHSAVVADAGENPRSRTCQAANARDQRFFREWQDSITIFTNCADAKQQLWFSSRDAGMRLLTGNLPRHRSIYRSFRAGLSAAT